MNLISTRQFVALTGLSRATIWRYRKKFPNFPQPIVLSPSSIRWVEQDVDRWIDALRKVA
ncbi:helix-turn-helix transcriptional regulator [Novosphingobium terrae]|uniref:helix-turn-helix transcriptional regulator n=1 Tax=Novosphingobium terrae TaxID=2726189 RepID=UPI0019825665